MNLKNWLQVMGLSLGLVVASVGIAQEAETENVVSEEATPEATPQPTNCPCPSPAASPAPTATPAPTAAPAPVDAPAAQTETAAKLQTCTFDIAFNLFPPFNSETRVPWVGLDLLNCSVVKSASEKMKNDKYAAGVFPGVEEENLGKWQVRVRQAYLGLNGGKAAIEDTQFEKLDAVSEKIKEGLTADTEYDGDGKYGPGGVDFYNKKLMAWTRYYDPERHAFIPIGTVNVIQTKDGHYAKFQVTKYIVNGGGYVPDEQSEHKDAYVWNPDLGAKDGKVHVVIRTVTNLAAEDARLK